MFTLNNTQIIYTQLNKLRIKNITARRNIIIYEYLNKLTIKNTTTKCDIIMNNNCFRRNIYEIIASAIYIDSCKLNQDIFNNIKDKLYLKDIVSIGSCVKQQSWKVFVNKYIDDNKYIKEYPSHDICSHLSIINYPELFIRLNNVGIFNDTNINSLIYCSILGMINKVDNRYICNNTIEECIYYTIDKFHEDITNIQVDNTEKEFFKFNTLIHIGLYQTKFLNNIDIPTI